MDNFYKKCQNLSKNTPFLGVNETQNEQGRSMVEMLGVLAIIGVLSVGAISGYRYAMNKYRANQLMNDINLRANDIRTKIELGQNNITLDEWEKTSSSGYKFSDIDTTSEPGKIKLSIENVPSKICEIIVKEMPLFHIIVDNSETMECNDNSDGNKLTIIFDDSEENNSPDCGWGMYYDSAQEECTYICQSETKPYWDGSNCIEEPRCSSNTQCNFGLGGGYYCQITKTPHEYDMYYNISGTCKKRGQLPQANPVTNIGNTYLLGSGNWWSAKNWCSSFGLSLISIAVFDCYDGSEKLTLPGVGGKYCCQKGYSSNQCKNDPSKLDPKIVEMKEYYGITPMWSDSDRKAQGEYETFAYVLPLQTYGYIESNWRDTSFKVVCTDGRSNMSETSPEENQLKDQTCKSKYGSNAHWNGFECKLCSTTTPVFDKKSGSCTGCLTDEDCSNGLTCLPTGACS